MTLVSKGFKTPTQQWPNNGTALLMEMQTAKEMPQAQLDINN